ncbi:MAG: hypothetical protein Q9160_003416 [Pyrenula sp. 1 TL-2023]
MVQLHVVRAANAALVKSQPIVAVFVGGTSGIGEYTLRALAGVHSDSGKGLRLYIVGRKAAAAETIISDCQRICPAGQFKFMQADDLALLKDVDLVCEKIVQSEEAESQADQKPRIDLLVMSQACSIFGQRKETKEGLDTLMSLMYYSRMRFINRLLPLLLNSVLPTRIVSIYAAGTEGKLLPNDLSLRDPAHYSYLQARSHITYMTTLFMETLAEQHCGKLSLSHVFPGLVITPAFQSPDIPTWFRLLWRVFGGLIARLYALAPAECGDRILFLSSPRFLAKQAGEAVGSDLQKDTATGAGAEIATGTDGIPGSGAYSVNWNGETISVQKSYRKIDRKDISKLVWTHTTGAFEEIEAGRVFTS